MRRQRCRGWLSPAAASKAIHIERDALAKLGPLAHSSGRKPPTIALEGGCGIDLVVGGHRVRVSTLKDCLYDGGSSTETGTLRDVELSPDGEQLAVIIELSSRFMEWHETSQLSTVVPSFE